MEFLSHEGAKNSGGQSRAIMALLYEIFLLFSCNLLVMMMARVHGREVDNQKM